MSAVGALGGGGGMVDEQKPSLFELLSEQQLHGLLPPTLRYLLTVTTQRYPRYLLRVLNSFDELYALAMLVVEHHYLRTVGGTFTEHFYGLKRERVLAAASRQHTRGSGSGGEVPRAAAGAPDAVRAVLQVGTNRAALWREIDAPRARLGAAYQRLPANPTLRDRVRHVARWFLRRVYPSVHAAYGFAVLACNLAYLFDGTRYANPLLWLVGTRVRRMTGADYRAIDDSAAAAAAAAGAKGGSRSVGARLLGGLSLVLPASIFALKFLEWWHASDFAKQLSRTAEASLELPPPIITGLPDNTTAHLNKIDSGASTTTATAAAGRKGILKKETARAFNNSYDDNSEGRWGAAIADADADADAPTEEEERARTAPVAKPSLLPIFTVPATADSALCPICGEDITTPTACQTGVVYCYICIHKWVTGQHAKQEAFMADKAGRWESGEGRCAVTGRRVLGGTEGLRRLMV
ncbi:peroxisome biosynthesis protein, pas10 [Niveomyces insectorum RCEF 264]|uniref:Peroxisome assembly protein 12 n=1 Tax=Niveomyces insectorum RCEF 264 TaxID=1081102 RepID=A0A162MQ89_9HYPO|nr:peroxisome biosynthesis protein, pas10 [Niveomyces insectorum RCEF 264]